MDQVIEHVYAAALDRSAWPAAIGAIRTYFSGASTGLYLADLRQASISMVHLEGIAPDYVDTYVDRYLTDNPWSFVAQFQLPGCVRTDQSLDQYYNDPGYYRRTAYFNDWMEPQGFIYTLGVNLAVDRHIQTKVYVYRSARTGAFDRRDIAAFARLSRHLHNAVKVARHLTVEQARSRDVLDVIEHVNFGVVLLTERGRITYANGFSEQLLRLRDGLVSNEGALATAHRGDAATLAKMIRTALEALSDGAEQPTAASIRRPGSKRPLSVLAVPLPPASETPLFAIQRAAVALIVTDPDREAAVPADALRARYNFNATEARLAQSLSRGVPLREAADTAGLTYETARWYLKGMFQKTSTARQADLVRLLLADHWLVS